VFGAVGTAGQRCTTTRRLFVHDSDHDSVVETLVKAYGRCEGKIGDPTLGDGTLMGPLNSPEAVRVASRRVEKAKASRRHGAHRRQGAPDRKGNFVLPTIVTGLANSR
jgi:aldehyde dehydrogenase (NAD+)